MASSAAFASKWSSSPVTIDMLRAATDRPATWVYNPDHAQGQLTSLQAGLRAVGDADAVFFTPIDYPSIRLTTLQLLLDNLATGDELAVPRYQGQRGHPILIRSSLIQDLLDLPASATARQVIHSHREATRYIDVDDEGILLDIDTPSDYLRLMQ
ncbi:MAG: nucleotidyltransferase family protein [Bryobacteraceae bacterium]